MLKFQTEDKELVILVKGITKRPGDLSQDDLKLMQASGDPRVVEMPDNVPAVQQQPTARVALEVSDAATLEEVAAPASEPVQAAQESKRRNTSRA